MAHQGKTQCLSWHNCNKAFLQDLQLTCAIYLAHFEFRGFILKSGQNLSNRHCRKISVYFYDGNIQISSCVLAFQVNLIYVSYFRHDRKVFYFVRSSCICIVLSCFPPQNQPMLSYLQKLKVKPRCRTQQFEPDRNSTCCVSFT